MAGYEVPLVLFDNGFEGALGVYFVFGKLMLLHKLFLIPHSVIVQILPHWLDVILICVDYFLGLLVLVGGRSAKIFLLMSLG
jgi:hypothetical protein